MVPSAQRHGELIADLPAERTALGEAQMMRITRQTAADQAWLFRHEADVLAVAHAARLWEGKQGFVDARSGLGAPPF